MRLQDIGWVQDASNQEFDAEQIARITCVHRGYCKALSSSGELNVYLSGKFHFDASLSHDKPATGDFVKISPIYTDDQNQKAAILEKILPRRSKISRVASGHVAEEQVLVSNIDLAFIVTSANEDISINRLQRYILIANEGSVTPVIILSKIDLMQNHEDIVSMIKERIPNVEILPVSSILNIGIKQMKEKLTAGTTAVFLGSSGVGKSTIVNAFLEKEIQATKAVRKTDSKGRHATTSRELFVLEKGGMIIDTAGLREIQVLASKEAMNSSFSKISNMIQNCKYTNCTHTQEPGCGILMALEDGSLIKEEYENYLKLQKEAEYAERKLSKAKTSNTKKRWKEIHKNMKAQKKFERKN
ncbi:MAG: ribosome small subunit-dependent GTPase A [Bdellovibrionales bacterium]|nr:ribosome small subunit-dependent GTPase A [Bdellovibrionales bacterium]